MSAENWLVLTDYSSKYRVSVSTLRRRIKSDQMVYRFSGGKYFLPDRPLEFSENHSAKDEFVAEAAPPWPDAPVKSDEPVLTTAKNILNELKEAYQTILKAKDEQILRLQRENADLQTLVHALESENQKLRLMK